VLLGESREGKALPGRGTGVSPRFFFLPRSLAKGAGDTGGEGFEIISKPARDQTGEGKIYLVVPKVV